MVVWYDKDAKRRLEEFLYEQEVGKKTSVKFNEALENAFTWSRTDQGHDYWLRLCFGQRVLTQEDVNILSEMLEITIDNKSIDECL